MRSAFCILMVAALILTTGCSGWVVTEASTAARVIASHPNIRVLKTDRTVLTVDSAVFRNDSIVGVSGGVPIGIPRADVKQIAVRGTDLDKSALMVIAAAVLGVAVVVIGSYQHD